MLARLPCLTRGSSNIKEPELKIMKLVHSATVLKESLEAHFVRFAMEPVVFPKETGILINVFTADYGR